MAKPWPSVPLGEILAERHETPSPDLLSSGAIRVIAKIGFNDGRIRFRSDSTTKTGMILVRPGDLVVSGINAAKGAIAVYEEENSKPIAATIHYGSYASNKDRANVRFLWWLLRSNTFREILAEHLPGGIKTELKAKRLLKVPIPLPPLSEQRRIVARIEELAAKIEEAKKLRAKSASEISAVLGARLQQLAEHKDAKGYLGAVLRERPRNGWSARCDNAENGTPVLSLGAVTGFRYKPQEVKRSSLPTQEGAYYWLQKGDLLITRSNTPELVGHAAIYDGTPFPCIYPDLMMRLDVDQSKAEKKFVWYWFQAPAIRKFILKQAKGTSPTMKKIAQDAVMAIPFPANLLLSEQHRIVQYLDDLQAKVDAIRKLQADTQAELDALLPSILDRAFRGEL